MEILKLLDQYPIIRDYEVLNYKYWQSGYYRSLKILFSDHSILFTKEFVDNRQRNYSYHWQKASGKMIIRRDNAPHHKHLKTFPYHLHIKENIAESMPMGLKDVLDFIEKNYRFKA